MMKVIPAIDIKGGKVVRLLQGDAKYETVYFDSPIDVARMWADQGAELIHVVDLDGAMEGKPKNIGLVKKMADEVKVKIEFGGGVRDEETVDKLINIGVEKVVIGTRALEENFISKILKKFANKIVIGIDAKDGLVLTKGWLFKTQAKAFDLAKKMSILGVKTINYTDISRDGMMQGPNIESLCNILKVKGVDIIASGGVSTIEDVKNLKALEGKGLKGMIIGKALYEKAINLKEAIKICSQKE